MSQKSISQTLKEALFIIFTVENMRKMPLNPYKTKDGIELSTRDVLRVGMYILHDLDKPHSLGAGNIVKTMINPLVTLEMIQLSPRTFTQHFGGFAKGTRMVRYYDTTAKGRKYLRYHIKPIEQKYTDRIDTLKSFDKNILNLL